MRFRNFSFIFTAALASLFAQFTSTTLTGVITDASGLAAPAAKITAQNIATGFTRTVSSSEDGSYLFPALPVGAYRLIVEKAGFSTYTQEGITLAVNQAATQSVALHPGAVSEHVTVSADASMIQTENATQSQLVNQQQIVDLPLNGRQAQNLVYLTAGSYDTSSKYSNCCYSGYASQGGVYPYAQFASVNGSGPVNTMYLMDGADNTDTYTNENFPFPNPDAIQEFSVQAANMSAEYGQGTAVVNVVTKSGTNQLHGDLFEFIRNGDLNARNYFAAAHDTLKRNQFGATAGGRIIRDKLFFFGSYQGTPLNQAAAGSNAFVPNAGERNGDFSSLPTAIFDPTTHVPYPNNQIPTSLLSAPSIFVNQHIPLPNGPNGLLTYLGPTLRQWDNQVMSKIDYIRGKNQFSGRYFYTRFSEPPDATTAKSNALATDGNGDLVTVQTVSVSHTYTASPSLVFSTWFGYERSSGGSLANAPFTFPEAGVQVAAPPGPPTIEQISASGYFSIASAHVGQFNRRDFRFREVITKERGAHEFRFGGDIFQIRSVVNNDYEQTPAVSFAAQYSGNNLADYMLGVASSFTQSAGQFYNYGGVEGDLFLQDNWRATKNLTINLGIRWDPFRPYTNAANHIPCFIPGEQSQRYPNAPTGMLFGGDKGCPSGSGTTGTTWNFAPRIGFAYRLGDKTVLRGGAGLYYGMPNGDINNYFSSVAPFAPTYALIDVSFANPYGSAGIANPFPAQYGIANPGPSATFTLPVGSVVTLPAIFFLPTVAMWNVEIQRQVTKDLLVRASYMGNAGYHLDYNQTGASLQIDPAVYIPGASTTANVQSRRLYPGFSGVSLYQDVLVSRYEALRISVEKRVSKGVSFTANYAWSKLESDMNTTDPYSMAFNWGIDRANLPNVFHFSALWRIPGAVKGPLGVIANGWEVAGITTWQSGFPITMTSGVDGSLSGGTSRADFLGTNIGQAVRSGQNHAAMVSQYFNTALYANNQINTFGNSPLNALAGPRFFDEDFSALKNFSVTERMKLQFRAEGFNIFNNVNFGQPGLTVGNPSFGKITSAQSSRIFQFGLKLSF